MAEEGVGLVAALQEVKSSLGDDVTREAVAGALHEVFPDATQWHFDKGHGVGLAKSDGSNSKLKSELDTFKQQVESLQAQNKELSANQPDVSKFQQSIENLQKQMSEKEQEYGKTIEGLKESMRQREFDLFNANAVAEAEALGIPKDFARAITMLPEYQNRIQRGEDGRPIGILQDDGVTPIHAQAGQSLESVVANQLLLAKTPQELRKDLRQSGGNIGSTGSGGGKKIWKASEIAGMSKDLDTFRKYEAEIDQAAAEGRVDPHR